MKPLYQKLSYISLICIGMLSIFAISNEEKNKITNEGTSRYVPTQVNFAGEETPLTMPDVKERFEKELLINANLHATTILTIKRANRVFPIIEPILKKYGIPDDFKYLAVIESGLVNVSSPAGAKGIWQFMPETAKEKGMEVNETIDERYHLEKATEAACKYILQSNNKFNSWTLAAASYNCGALGISRQLEMQRVQNYYDLLLNEETSRYVFRILALKEIMKNPDKYGFNLNDHELYDVVEMRKIEVDSSISNLADFAISQGVNYKILKIYNPWLRDRKLHNPNRKKYVLEIPIEKQ